MLQHDFQHWWTELDLLRDSCVQRLGAFLVADNKTVRVSAKAIALGCVSLLVAGAPDMLHLQLTSSTRSVWDAVKVLRSHSDPLLRGNLQMLVGIAIEAIVLRERLVLGQPTQTATAGETVSPSVLAFLVELSNVLIAGLVDEAATVVRMAVSAIKTCAPTLCQSTAPALGVHLLRLALETYNSSYWLVKTEVLQLPHNVDFLTLAFLTQAGHDKTELLPEGVQASCLDRPRHPFGVRRSIQDECLDVCLHLLGDSDGRVREAATETLVQLVNKLFFSCDWPGRSPLVALAHRQSTTLCSLNARTPPQTRSPQQLFLDRDLPPSDSVARANLSRVVQRIVAKLHSSQSRPVLVGCYRALSELSNQKTFSQSVRMPNADLEGSAMPPIYAPDVLPLALDHIKVAWISLDLSVHVDVLGLIGHLSVGAQLEHFRPYAQQLLLHVLRVLNICVHVIEGTTPSASSTPSKSKTKPRTTPERPRQRLDSEGSLGAMDEEESEEFRPPPPGSPKGYFMHLPHYMRLHDTLTGAYKAGKLTLDSEQTTRFGDLVKVALEVLAVVVASEAMSFHGYAEEVLSYLKVVIIPEPRAVLLCVQQLLVALFGSSPSSPKPFNERGGSSEGTPGKPRATTKTGFFDHCHGLDSKKLSYQRGLATSRVSLSSTSTESLIKSRSDTLLSGGSANTSGFLSPAKPVVRTKTSEAIDKATMFGLIRLFEPLVIRALNQYMTTGSVPLQQQILFLLCRLMTLRVNYSLLDKDQVFVNSILKQLEMIAAGQVRNCHQLLSYIFQFLVLLAQEHNRLTDVINMPKILHYVGTLMSSESISQRQSLPALRPIVHELFMAPPGRRGVRDAAAQREHVLSLLSGLSDHVSVLDQMTTLLKIYSSSEDKWKRLSRKVVDSLLPLLSQRKVTVKNIRSMQVIHNILNEVAPIALRPVVLLLRCLFSSATPDIVLCEPGADIKGAEPPAPTINAFGQPEEAFWLPVSLVMIKCISRTSEVALLSGMESLYAGSAELPAVEDVFMQFLFDILKFSFGALCGARGPSFQSGFFAQLVAQLLLVMQELLEMFDQPSSRLFSAARRVASGDSQRLCDLLLPCIHSHPLLVVYTVQLMLVLGVEDMSCWWALTLPQGGASGSVPLAERCTPSFSIAQHGCFLLQCADLVQTVHMTPDPDPAGTADTADNSDSSESRAAAEAQLPTGDGQHHGASDTVADQIAGQLLAMPDEWFVLMAGASSETPVRLVMSEVVAAARSELREQFLDRLDGVLSGADRQSPSWSIELLRLLQLLPAEARVLRTLLCFLSVPHVVVQRVADEALRRHFGDWVTALQRDQEPTHAGTQDTLRQLELFRDGLNRVVSNASSACPGLAAAFSHLGLPIDPEKEAEYNIEDLMADSPEAWHGKLLADLCRPDQRTSRSPTAVCSMLQRLSLAELRVRVRKAGFDLSLLEAMVQYGEQLALRGRPVDISASGAPAEEDGEDDARLFDVASELVFEILDPGVDVEAHRLPLMRALTKLLHCHRITACKPTLHRLDSEGAWHPTPLSMQHAVSCIRFIAACIGSSTEDGVVLVPSYAVALVECAEAVYGHPGIRDVVGQALSLGTSSSSNTAGAKGDDQAPDPPAAASEHSNQEQEADVPGGTSSKLCACRDWVQCSVDRLVRLYEALSGHSLPALDLPSDQDEENREADSSQDPPSELLPRLPRQLLFVMTTVDSLPTSMCQGGGIVDGIAIELHRPRQVSPLMRNAFRGVALALAQLFTADIVRLSLASNPETGAISPTLYEQLGTPGSGPLRDDLLQDELVMKRHIRCLNLLGWSSPHSFRLIWDELMPTLLRDDSMALEMGLPQLELDSTRVLCLRGITSLLMGFLRAPWVGDSSAEFRHYPRVKDISFLHTRAGQRLVQVRCMLNEDAQEVFSAVAPHRAVQLADPAAAAAAPFYLNVERALFSQAYGHGQVASQVLASQCTAASDGPSSPNGGPSRLSPTGATSPPPMVGKADSLRRKSPLMFGPHGISAIVHSTSPVKLSQQLDAVISVVFSWLTPPPRVSLWVVTESVKMLLMLSDLFTDFSMHTKLLDTFVELAKSFGQEDSTLLRYLIPGVCKSISVLTLGQRPHEHQDHVAKMLEDGLASTSVSTVMATLHGFMYLLEANVAPVYLTLLPTFTERIATSLRPVAGTTARYLMLLYSTAFAIIEHCPNTAEDLQFTSRAVQTAAKLAQLSAMPHDCLFHTVIHGLDRLLLAFTLSKTDRDCVASLSDAKYRGTMRSGRAVLTLGLMLTCMYSGKDSETPGSGLMTNVGAGPVDAMDTVSVVTMERITALCQPLRHHGVDEAHMLRRVLPAVLVDFYQPRQIMNVVMSEFTSTQQSHPELIAPIVFNVFQSLRESGFQADLCSWSVLSMSSFLQRAPESLAVASLACLFCSVSQSPLIRSLLQHVVYRTEKVIVSKDFGQEMFDPRLFWLPAIHFFLNESLAPELKAMFLSVLESIPSHPYAPLATLCCTLAAQQVQVQVQVQPLDSETLA
eukprot:m.412655 g.412655  ORF g.412655 m.412655 type:complete len:2510 (+) comp20171_c0_seq3:1285-8814(+)